MRRRVVITGMGAVTPVGHSVAETFANVLEGKSGVARITHFDAATFPTTFAAEVKNFDLGRFIRNAARYDKSGANTRFALAAAKQALEDANLRHRPGLNEQAGAAFGPGARFTLRFPALKNPAPATERATPAAPEQAAGTASQIA